MHNKKDKPVADLGYMTPCGRLYHSCPIFESSDPESVAAHMFYWCHIPDLRLFLSMIEDKVARMSPATVPTGSRSRSRSRSQPRTDPDPGGGELPPSLLHDPDVDTYEVDKRGRWLEERDEYFYREGRRGEGTEYVGAVPVSGMTRGWIWFWI